MYNRLDKEIYISPSLCDHSGKLGIPNTFSLFMDLAGEHAEALGIGQTYMGERGLFWVAVKTRIRLFSRPKIMSLVTASTWSDVLERIRTYRYYTVTDGSQLISEGKTEWTIINMNSGKIARFDDGMKAMVPVPEKTVCNGEFSRVKDSFSDAEQFGVYTVRSADIDMGKHMNNAAYVRALIGAFSTDELDSMNISELEICYRIPCYEGEKLTFKRIKTDSGYEIGVIKADGKAAAVIIMTIGVK